MRRKEFKLRKIAGEENPADLLAKDLGSSKRLDQLLKLFYCSTARGRAESAPGTKTAKGADDRTGVSLVELQVPPHQLPRADHNRKHIIAVLDEERYGEADRTPQRKLSDPVPHIVGGSERAARQSQKRVPNARRDVPTISGSGA